jgi:hypothetical protein
LPEIVGFHAGPGGWVAGRSRFRGQWAGAVQPVQALRSYRERSGIAARLVVVGMVSNGFTIAEPDDPGMLDVVGFNTATPAVIAGFAVATRARTRVRARRLS